MSGYLLFNRYTALGAWFVALLSSACQSDYISLTGSRAACFNCLYGCSGVTPFLFFLSLFLCSLFRYSLLLLVLNRETLYFLLPPLFGGPVHLVRHLNPPQLHSVTSANTSVHTAWHHHNCLFQLQFLISSFATVLHISFTLLAALVFGKPVPRSVLYFSCPHTTNILTPSLAFSPIETSIICHAFSYASIILQF